MNKEWHAKNPMPPKATTDQRIKWHIKHREHCGCRPVPEKLAEEMKKRGIV